MHRVEVACCRTALAEAEIEYKDSYCSPSVYVKYRLQQLSGALEKLGNISSSDASLSCDKHRCHFFSQLVFIGSR